MISRKAATISPIIVIGFERGKAHPPNGILGLVFAGVHTTTENPKKIDANITTNPAMMIESFKEIPITPRTGF